MNLRTFLPAAVFLLLGGAVAAGLTLTREPAAAQVRKARPRAEEYQVDQAPINTARRLAAQAASTEEKSFAHDALRLADHEVDLAFAEALRRAAAAAPPATAEVRDLARRPLFAHELKGYKAICLDPPRAGAGAQAAELAKAVPGGPTTIAMVSCNPATLARDLRLLVDGREANVVGVVFNPPGAKGMEEINQHQDVEALVELAPGEHKLNAQVLKWQDAPSSHIDVIADLNGCSSLSWQKIGDY